MTASLVGAQGAVSVGTSGAAVTPAYGTGASRTAGNLLVLQVGTTGSATLPGAISGWTIAKQQAGTSCSASVYFKVAAGADAAPAVPAVTSAIHNAQLSEFFGLVGTVDQTAGVNGTTTPQVATAAAVDALAGNVVIAAAASVESTARANTMTHTLNNGATAVSTNNNATSTTSHYNHAYGITTGKASADSDSMAVTTTSLTGTVLALVSFKVTPSATRVAGFPVSISSATSGTVVPQNVGDIMIVAGRRSDGSASVTGISGGGCTNWTKVVDRIDASDFVYSFMWMGTVSTTGSQTITLTVIGSSSNELTVDSFHSPAAGSWQVDASGTGNNAASVPAFPSVTATKGAAPIPELYYAWMFTNGAYSAANGNTPGYHYEDNPFIDGPIAFSSNVVSGAQQPGFSSAPASALWITVAAIFYLGAPNLPTPLLGQRQPHGRFRASPPTRGHF